MRGPQDSCQNPPRPQNSPLGPKKVKNDPKIKSKSNVGIEGSIENESCSTTLGLQKVKNDPKIKSN